MRKSYIIGALNRGNFRRSLTSSGVDYKEVKGILDSQFTIEASANVHQRIVDYLNKIKFIQEFDFFDYKIKNGKDVTDFLIYVQALTDEDCMVESKKGWFKTRVSVFCHPSTAKKFDNWIDTLTKIKNML